MKTSTRNDPSLIMAAAAGDIAARDAVIQQNMGVIYKIARQYSLKHSCIDIEDCIQEGILGVIDAIPCFKPEFGVKFISYARWAIEHRMSFHVDVSLSLTGKPMRKNIKRNRNHPMATRPSAVTVIPVRATQHSEAVVSETVASVQRAIDVLTERDAAIIRRRMAGDTLAVVGKSLGVTRERVRQLELRAHNKLRELLGHI